MENIRRCYLQWKCKHYTHSQKCCADYHCKTRWLVIALLDGLTEIGILVVAISLVSQLQMKLSKKITVLAAFVWRLGLVQSVSIKDSC
jgi:hypothetical protein